MNKNADNNDESFNDKVETLKSYIQRVTDGEDIESVQADFKENFSHVPAKVIAQAEQRMMADGAKMEDIQKLCDIHSVLFHDMTDEERMERLKEEMQAHQQTSYVHEESIANVDDVVSEKTMKYKNTIGHPLQILSLENNAIEEIIDEIRVKLDDAKNYVDVEDDLIRLSAIRQHYAKKDDLLFPLLKDKYDYPGPAKVMWAVEDEIKGQLHNVKDNKELLTVLKRIEEMIYKENNILFPLCVEHFSDEEWIMIAEDMQSYHSTLLEKIPKWDKTTVKNDDVEIIDESISLPGGKLTLKQIRAILNIIPMEITIIDDEDMNTFFDEDENKVFLRPKMALNRNMYSCHPPRVENMVRKLLDDFKSGKRDSMHVLSDVNGISVLTNYYALRDEYKNYLGTMEAVIHIDGIVNCSNEGIKGPVDYDKIFPN